MNLDASQEETFLEKATRGERAGIDYLVKKYKNMAYSVAFKIVSNREDAEEVVQDAFLKAFKSLPKFQRASRFSTWLYRITYNTAIRKRQQRPDAAVSLNGAEHDEIPNPIENDLLQSNERSKFVELAIKQLATDDYLVISLHYIGEKTVADICEILGLRRSAVKMRLMRARRQLELNLKTLLNSEIDDLL